MKASRLLSMLLLLQSAERRSARELAAALEVSERTVYRDVDALSAAGVPVYAQRGVYGGICLSAGYRKALTQFGEDEIRALFISGSNPLGDLGLGVGRERALEKLSGAMNDAQRKAAVKTRGRIHLDQRRWNQAEQPQAHLAALRLAVWDDRRVSLRYRDPRRTQRNAPSTRSASSRRPASGISSRAPTARTARFARSASSASPRSTNRSRGPRISTSTSTGAIGPHRSSRARSASKC